MQTLISAAITTFVGDADAPAEIVYLPEGTHHINPSVNGKPAKVTVNVPAEKGAEIAASFQKALDERNKQNVRAWFDFEHKRGTASALPKSFRYEQGKGIMVALEWTGAGRTAIEGKDFSYFSPEFYLGDDGIPDGLPERGPLGGLVNEPAFREIPRIAAADTVAQSSSQQSSKPQDMKHLLAKLQINPSAEDAETAAITKITAMESTQDAATKRIAELEAELAELKKAKEEAEAKSLAAASERADSIVAAAVTDGRLAPKDKASQDKYRTRIAAGDEFAAEVLATLPKLHTVETTPIVKAAATEKEEEQNPYAKVQAAFADEVK